MTNTWQVLVPVKALDLAKSRLELVAPMRRSLALAMLHDVVEACTQATGVHGVTIVSADDAAFAVPSTGSLRCRGDHLNEDLAAAIATTRAAAPEVGIAIVVADLPGLQAAELASVLTTAPTDRASLVAGRDGGTTVLLLPPGVDIEPGFGPGSAARHALVAVEHEQAAPGLRRDVDSMDDLNEAARLGVGGHTVAWLREMRRASAPMRCTI